MFINSGRASLWRPSALCLEHKCVSGSSSCSSSWFRSADVLRCVGRRPATSQCAQSELALLKCPRRCPSAGPGVSAARWRPSVRRHTTTAASEWPTGRPSKKSSEVVHGELDAEQTFNHTARPYCPLMTIHSTWRSSIPGVVVDMGRRRRAERTTSARRQSDGGEREALRLRRRTCFKHHHDNDEHDMVPRETGAREWAERARQAHSCNDKFVPPSRPTRSNEEARPAGRGAGPMRRRWCVAPATRAGHQ
jgi:hypothetical protein